MRLRPLLLALSLLLAATAVAAPAASAAKRKVPRGFMGVMYDGRTTTASPEVQDRQFTLMAKSGVEATRLTFDWAAMQPERDDPIDFSETDVVVRRAAVHGISVLPVMIYAPGWARVFRGRAFSPPLTEPYQRFLAASIRRYGSDGSYWRENPEVPRQPVRDWQIWNEPNLKYFWNVERSNKPAAWPRGYVTLLRASHRTIERTDPQARTVMGGLVGLAWLELKRLYKAGGRGAFDVVALHVYAQTPARVKAVVRRMRAELRDQRDNRKRIWITETAFPASRGRADPIDYQRQETPATMADRLRTTYRTLIADRVKLGIDRVYWYTWASGYSSKTNNFEYAGLLSTENGSAHRAQPALRAYQRVAHFANGCSKTERAVCR